MSGIVPSLFLDTQTFVLPREYRVLVPAIAVSFMMLEYAAARLNGREVFDVKEAAASFGVAIGDALVRAAQAGIVALPFAFVYRHRLANIPIDSVWSALALFLGVEFLFYVYHFAAHNVRWLWATHAVHHTPTRINLSAGIRLGWTGLISGNFLFFLPLVWLGFHPLAVLAMIAISLAYQFFIHTELAPGLGPLELVMNTPRHHLVHHACNPGCGNKNYGGVLIIYDRLFGTFAEHPREELRFGLANSAGSYNPVHIAFHEWLNIARDVRQSASWRERIRAMFGAPSN
jgi:sterol desaturase/sphingolipid hydroxylase (fatty acid hydroxylase superfamily)